MTLTFTDAKILRPDGWSDAPVSVSHGVISDQPGRELGLSGLWVVPGIVDAHGDGFERHMAPRRGAVTDMQAALHGVSVALATNGITTAYLAQFWSWEGGMRGPEFAKALAAALRIFDTPLDMRLQLRVETHMIADFQEIASLIGREGIDYVVFNDHLPHRHLAAGKPPPRLTGQALKAGRSPAAHEALLKDLYVLAPQVPAALDEFCVLLQGASVRIASHDDADLAEREIWAARGAQIAEFPLSVEAAVGDVVMGAPNVVRGGSHKGQLSAEDILRAGRCRALASDYHYPMPLQAAFALVERGVCDFPAAWGYVSSGPAAMLGFSDRGHLSQGARADLIVVDPKLKRVVATFAAGQPVYVSGVVAERLLSAL